MARGRIRRYYRKAKYYSSPRYIKKSYRRKKRKVQGMTKAQRNNMLKGAGVATAILIFMPAVYLKIAEALGRGDQ